MSDNVARVQKAARILRKHLGPGNHPDGTPQTIHGKKGSGRNTVADFFDGKPAPKPPPMPKPTFEQEYELARRIGDQRFFEKPKKQRQKIIAQGVRDVMSSDRIPKRDTPREKKIPTNVPKYWSQRHKRYVTIPED